MRAEGPRDYVDLLLSMKHQPNVVLIDMAHMVAAHGNLRKPEMFSPFQGPVAAAKEANIEAAKEGRLIVDMPWLIDSSNEHAVDSLGAGVSDHTYHTPVHPLTGTIMP